MSGYARIKQRATTARARAALTNLRNRAKAERYSGCSLASLTTLRHFGSSERMYFTSRSGEPAIDSKYWRSRKLFLISGRA
jgi:hypothetical protein